MDVVNSTLQSDLPLVDHAPQNRAALPDASLTKFPATRALKMSPMPWSKINCIDSREYNTLI